MSRLDIGIARTVFENTPGLKGHYNENFDTYWKDLEKEQGERDAEIAAQNKPTPERGVLDVGKDLGKAFAGGAVGSTADTLRGLDWVKGKLASVVSGDDSPGAMTRWADALGEIQKENLTPEAQGFIYDLASGAGSMATFLVPGMGVGGAGAKAAGVLAARGLPRLANVAAKGAGLITGTGLEAVAEGGGTLRDMADSPKEDRDAATTKTVLANAALLGLTNKLSGIFDVAGGSRRSVLGAGLRASPFEGAQEAGQNVIQSVAQGKDIDPGQAAYEGAIGAIIGGGAGSVGAAVNNRIAAGQEKAQAAQAAKDATRQDFQDFQNGMAVQGEEQRGQQINAYMQGLGAAKEAVANEKMAQHNPLAEVAAQDPAAQAQPVGPEAKASPVNPGLVEPYDENADWRLAVQNAAARGTMDKARLAVDPAKALPYGGQDFEMVPDVARKDRLPAKLADSPAMPAQAAQPQTRQAQALQVQAVAQAAPSPVAPAERGLSIQAVRAQEPKGAAPFAPVQDVADQARVEPGAPKAVDVRQDVPAAVQPKPAQTAPVDGRVEKVQAANARDNAGLRAEGRKVAHIVQRAIGGGRSVLEAYDDNGGLIVSKPWTRSGGGKTIESVVFGKGYYPGNNRTRLGVPESWSFNLGTFEGVGTTSAPSKVAPEGKAPAIPPGVNVRKSGQPYTEKEINLAVANFIKRGKNVEAVQIGENAWGWREVKSPGIGSGSMIQQPQQENADAQRNAGQGRGGLGESELPGSPASYVEGAGRRPGRRTEIAHSEGRDSGRFELREADELIPSHDANRGFIKHEAYPENVQERPYHRDRAEQQKVTRNAAHLDPAYIVNDNPDAINGPPIVTEDGVVLGGNSRTMSIQMAYLDHPEKADAYRRAIEAKADQFGFRREDVAAMRRPVLVRVAEGQIDAKAQARKARLYNQTAMQALDPKAEGVSKARMVTGETMDVAARGMGMFDTLRQYLGDRASRDLVVALERDGIIEASRRNALVDERTGLLTDDGKKLVENVLRGAVLEDFDLIAGLPDGVRNKLDRSLPALFRIKQRGGKWDVLPDVRQAVRRYAEFMGSGKKHLEDFLGQGSLISDNKDSNSVKAILNALEYAKPTLMAEMFNGYAGQAEAASRHEGQSTLPGMSEAVADPVAAYKRLEAGLLRVAGAKAPGGPDLFTSTGEKPGEDPKDNPAVKGGRIYGESANGLNRGDILKDSSGKKYAFWDQRHGVMTVHPVENGKPVVNADSGVRVNVDDVAKARNQEYRSDDFFRAERQVQAAQAAEEKPQAEPTSEKLGLTIGEKIGGSRKDTSESSGPRVRIPGKDGEGKAWWQKRFEAVQVKESNFRTGDSASFWSIADAKGKLNMRGQAFRFDTKEEAEAAIPLAAVSLKHRVTSKGDGTWEVYRKITDRKFVTIKGGFASKEDAQRYLAQNAAEILDIKTGYGEEILAKPEKVMREGAPRRTGPAKGQDFLDTFGFRGVEFGEWNDQLERQEVLNHAYDGLRDLAEIINLPPRALSLNGELALAFGARGRGLSSAKAHYERDYGVINLTKMTGAGSLAHEWFHAMDHYFARQDTKASSEKAPNERGDMVFKASRSPAYDFQSHGPSIRSSKLRDELKAAYKSLMHTMTHKAEKFKEDTEKAEKFVGRARGYLEKQIKDIRAGLARELQWGKKRAPATADQLAKFDALADQLLSGDNLTLEMRDNDTGPKKRSRFGSYRNSNDVLDGMAAIYKEARGRSGFNSEKTGPFNTLAAYVQDYARRAKMLADARNETEHTKQVPTEFVRDAYVMDRGRTSDYWSELHELAARAFSAYIEDKTKGEGRRSDFLVYGANNNMMEYRLINARPFPDGSERQAINAAFDKFFQVVETKETDKGVRMYSLREDGIDLDKEVPVVEVKPALKNRNRAYMVKGDGSREIMRHLFGKEDGPIRVTIESDGLPVTISKRNARHAISSATKTKGTAGGITHLEAVMNLPGLVRNASRVTGMSEMKAQEAVKGVTRYVAAMRLGESDYAVMLTIKHFGGERHIEIEGVNAVHDMRVPKKMPVPNMETGTLSEGKQGRANSERRTLSTSDASSRRDTYKIRDLVSGVKNHAGDLINTEAGTATGELFSNAISDTGDPKAPGLGVKRVTNILSLYQRAAKGAARMEVIEAKDLPRYVTAEHDPAKIEGYYDKGIRKVVLVADNLKSPAHAVTVWMHEQVGHHGIRGTFGNDKAFRVFLDTVAEERGFTGADKHSQAEEYLARLAEKYDAKGTLEFKELGLWDRMVEAVRSWLRRHGVAKLSQGDIDRVIRKALARVAKGADAEIMQREEAMGREAEAATARMESRFAELRGRLQAAQGEVMASTVDDAAHEAATSPKNDLPEPTQSQKEAGNYRKGHITVQGLDIAIENPAGSVRSGVSRDGKAWETRMADHYGYIKGTVGKDKDHLDVFVGPGAESAQKVFVVNQVDPKTGRFDEHKVMLGFASALDAEKAYLRNYEKGWQGLKSMAEMTMPEFKDWLASGETKRPVAAGNSWSRQVDDYLSGKPIPGKMLDMGRSPAIIGLLGGHDLPLMMTLGKAGKIMNDKHGMSAAVVKALPEAIERPVMAFKSATMADSIVLVTDLKHDGKFVVAAVHLNVREGRAEINEVASAYGKDNGAVWIMNQAASGRLLYVDKTKTPGWQRSFRLQLPPEMPPRGTRKVFTKADLVKYERGLPSGDDGPRFRTSAPHPEDDMIAYDPKDKGPSMLSKEGRAAFWGKLYQQFVDSAHPVIKAATGVSREFGQAMREEYSRLRGSAGPWLEALEGNGLRTWWKDEATGKVEGSKSLKQALAPIKSDSDLKDLASMMVAERMVALAKFRPEYAREQYEADKRYIKGLFGEAQDAQERKALTEQLAALKAAYDRQVKGVDADRARGILKRLEGEYGRDGMARLKEAAANYRTWSKQAILDPMLESGIMSQDRYDAIVNAPEGEWYVPFMREMEQVERVTLGAKEVIKRLHGSERGLRIIPPVEAGISNLQRAVRLVNQNRVNTKFVSIKDLSPDLAEAIQEVKVDPARVRPGQYVMTFENGQKRYWDMPKEFRVALEGMEPKEANFVWKMLETPTKWLRAGSTLTLEFMTRNPLRDQWTAFLNTKYGYIPFVDFAKGLGHVIGKTDMLAEWRAAGGDQAFFTSLDHAAKAVQAKEIMGFDGNKLMKYAKNPLEALRLFSEFMEKGTRVGAYAKARSKGATPQQAAHEAREITIDFSRAGTVGRELNRIIAFWNANIQDIDKVSRTWKDRPGVTTAKILLGITLPSLALAWAQKDDDEYRSLPDWQRNLFWNIRVPGGKEFITLPKPFAPGILFGSVPERMVDYAVTGDRKAVKSSVLDALASINPFDLPTAIKPVVQMITGYDFFRGRAIEGQGDKKLVAAYRGGAGTSATLRKATEKGYEWTGGVVNVGPAMLMQAVRGYTGGLGKMALDGADIATRAADKPDVADPSLRWNEYPLVRGLVKGEPIGPKSGDIDRFYDYKEEAAQAMATYKTIATKGKDAQKAAGFLEQHRIQAALSKEMEKAARHLSKLRQASLAVMQEKGLSGDAKRERLDDLDRRATNIAKSANRTYLERTKKAASR